MGNDIKFYFHLSHVDIGCLPTRRKTHKQSAAAAALEHRMHKTDKIVDGTEQRRIKKNFPVDEINKKNE
jgi:nicotinic acid mononucleotide adenylyltransferase